METRRYVDFDQDNFRTYSIEFLKLYQTVCSEIDVIGKSMATLMDGSFHPDDKKNNIFKWWNVIQEAPVFPIDSNWNSAETVKLSEFVCNFLDTFEMKPWDNFHVETYRSTKNQLRYRLKPKSSIPTWWSSYNSVKHGRTYTPKDQSGTTNYRKANLGNLIKAFAALYTIELAYMELIGTKDDLESFADYSKLFVKTEIISSSEIDALFNSSLSGSFGVREEEALLAK
jgi:hypothetical protein